jgi:hypothetical protein
MAYITNETELKEYILRRLGSEAHRVEISDTNWDDIFNTSSKYLYEHFADAVNEKAVLVEVNNSRDLILNDNIIAVQDIHVSTNDLGLYLAYPGISPIYDFVSSGDRGAVSSYLTTMSYIREIQQTFKKYVHFKFNPESKRLILGEEVLSALLIVQEKEDITLLYNSEYFHKILEANAWRIWATNTGKYAQIQIGNGQTINREDMKERYQELMEEIKSSIENEEYDFLGPIRLNSL